MKSANELLQSYAAGSLGPGLGLMAVMHQQLRPEAAEDVRAFEAAGGVLLDTLEGVHLSGDAFEATMSRLGDRSVIAVEPAADPLSELLYAPLENAAWRSSGLPGMYEADLPGVSDPAGRAQLVKLSSGRVLPTHAHDGFEWTLVLEGGYRDGATHYGRGDIAYADESIEHQPKVDLDGDCICLTVTSGSVHMTRPFVDVLRYFASGLRTR